MGQYWLGNYEQASFEIDPKCPEKVATEFSTDSL